MTTTDKFIFQGWKIQDEKVLFHYRLEHLNETFNFTDTLILPSDVNWDTPKPLLESSLNSLLLILGISYWKIFCPINIQINSFSLTKEQSEFWNKVYTKGLGEFFYENKIDFRGLVNFPYDKNKTLRPIRQAQGKKNRSLLPIGGGKDSIVAAELLKKAGKDFSTVTILNGLDDSIQSEVVKKIGQENFVVKRFLDPKVFELNKRKDTYNGHVPVVSIYSFITTLLAVLLDFRYVIFANEESASFGNIEYCGEVVNHQWSKSLEFEELFQNYLSKYVTYDIYYFSLLRPFTEIKIVQLFSKYPKYFSTFVSCNAAYKITNRASQNWCGKCPKCAFIFAALAAFLSKKEIVRIFGKNLMDDKSLLPLYKELLGVKNFKPFECVGTPEEVRVAFYFAYKRHEWDDTVIMKYFVKEVLPKIKDISGLEKKVFSFADNRIPKEFVDVIRL